MGRCWSPQRRCKHIHKQREGQVMSGTEEGKGGERTKFYLRDPFLLYVLALLIANYLLCYFII